MDNNDRIKFNTNTLPSYDSELLSHLSNYTLIIRITYIFQIPTRNLSKNI